jgi:transcriptional regulator with GAF, ATPase, and Fis domain
MVLEPTGRSALTREIARVPLPANGHASTPPPPSSENGEVIAEDDMRALERQNVINALGQAGWQISGPGGAAALLGLSPSTLTYRLKRLGIERPR